MEDRILFVDDESSLLRAIDRLLGFDYELDFAESGPDALEVIRERGPFPVIVTDMRMPGMNGIEFIEEARKIADSSVFAMLTGNDDAVTAEKAKTRAKVHRFLNKPCSMEEIKATIVACQEQFEAASH